MLRRESGMSVGSRCLRVAWIGVFVGITWEAEAQPTIVLTRITTPSGEEIGVRATDSLRLLDFKVYFDEQGAQMARASVPMLAEMYAKLAADAGAGGRSVKWAPVEFVASSTKRYTSATLRWTVPVEPDGTLGAEGEAVLYQLVPHEQVHSLQLNACGVVPYWFTEGHAEWAGLLVTQVWRPKLAQARYREFEVRAADSPGRLSSFGPTRVTEAMIRRQMTPEQKLRRNVDPSYRPSGPIAIPLSGRDVAERMAGYANALAVFRELDRAKGRAAVSEWLAKRCTARKSATNRSLTAEILDEFGVDISPWFK